jgi:hypothetical protein
MFTSAQKSIPDMPKISSSCSSLGGVIWIICFVIAMNENSTLFGISSRHHCCLPYCFWPAQRHHKLRFLLALELDRRRAPVRLALFPQAQARSSCG